MSNILQAIYQQQAHTVQQLSRVAHASAQAVIQPPTSIEFWFKFIPRAWSPSEGRPVCASVPPEIMEMMAWMVDNDCQPNFMEMHNADMLRIVFTDVSKATFFKLAWHAQMYSFDNE